MSFNSNVNIKLTSYEVEFLQSRFKMADPNKAIDAFIELLVTENVNPLFMKIYLAKWMSKTVC